MPAGSAACTAMVSGLPRTPDSTAWCVTFGASPSSIGPCAWGCEVDGAEAAGADFFLLLFFETFVDLLEDFLLFLLFFFDDFAGALLEAPDCAGAEASVCAIAEAAKHRPVATAKRSFRRCISALSEGRFRSYYSSEERQLRSIRGRLACDAVMRAHRGAPATSAPDVGKQARSLPARRPRRRGSRPT